MKKILYAVLLASFFCQCSSDSLINEPPNIVLIITDDQGWNDVGFNGSLDINTPHLDKIASNGAVFSQGYVSHPYCSPSRAGLLSGRYQQHFGHECNPGYIDYQDSIPDGLPLDEILLSQVLKENEYLTAAVGKWHLGDDPEFWPSNRGFDHWYGFSGGGRGYWPDKDPGASKAMRSESGEAETEEFTYLTDDLTEYAVRFIKKNKQKPFFIYLAYNAPHAPIHATREYLEMTDYLEDGERSAYAAMIAGIDEGVGEIRKALEEADIYKNTIVIYLSDNGGHSLGASNYPYRGHKGMLFEGGIRVPFMVSWPAGIKEGTIIDEPVISLDLFPTILEAAGISCQEEIKLDGISLLPLLNKEVTTHHESLFWRYSNGQGYAVRQGDYKLVQQHMKPLMLFDMASDPYEQNNLTESLPEKAKQLKELYQQWDQENIVPLWIDPHIPNVEKQENTRQHFRKRAAAGDKSSTP